MTHDGGTRNVTANQQYDGGQWVLLGVFDLTPTTAARVEINDIGNSTYVIADGIRAVRHTTAETEFVVDNASPGAVVTGTWATGTSKLAGVPRGANYLVASGDLGTNKVTWPLGVGSAGKYRVFARWMMKDTRSSSVPYTVTHDGGTTTVNVDQRYNGGEWYPLGLYDLTPASGHQVEVTDLGAGTAAADAILVVPEDTLTTPLVAADAVRVVANDAEDVLYVHADHLTSPQKMTDDTGAVVWDAAFTPFGQEASITGTASNDNRFPGQSFDDETDLHYNYRRDYDPALGRYLQSDPIGLAGGLNTYGYVGGNPITRIDPTGELAWFVAPAIGGGVGAGIEGYRQLSNNNFDFASLDYCRIGIAGVAGALGGGIGGATVKFGFGNFLAINFTAGGFIGAGTAAANGGGGR